MESKCRELLASTLHSPEVRAKGGEGGVALAKECHPSVEELLNSIIRKESWKAASKISRITDTVERFITETVPS